MKAYKCSMAPKKMLLATLFILFYEKIEQIKKYLYTKHRVPMDNFLCAMFMKQILIVNFRLKKWDYQFTISCTLFRNIMKKCHLALYTGVADSPNSTDYRI